MTGAKDDAVRNLRDLESARDVVGIPLILMDGTLLGAYRDGDFCEEDEDDVDIAVMDHHYQQVDLLVDVLLSRGFYLKDTFLVNGQVEGTKLERGGSHFDIARINFHPWRDECYNWGRDKDGNLVFVYPSKHYLEFENIQLHGCRFLAPSDPEGLLSHRYGDWDEPIPRSKFDWRHGVPPGVIRTRYPPVL